MEITRMERSILDLHLLFLKGMNRRANRPDSAGAGTAREMQRQSGETHGQKCSRLVP